VVGSALRAFGGNGGGGGGGGYRSPNYLAQAINEQYRPGPDPKEPKSIWPSLGESARQAQQANAAAEREAKRLADLRADGRKAMEAVSKLAAERRAAAQGIGVLDLTNTSLPQSTNNLNFNLPELRTPSQNRGIGSWLDERRHNIQQERIQAIKEVQPPMPIPKSQASAERLRVFQQVTRPQKPLFTPQQRTFHAGVSQTVEIKAPPQPNVLEKLGDDLETAWDSLTPEEKVTLFELLESFPKVGSAVTVINPYKTPQQKTVDIATSLLVGKIPSVDTVLGLLKIFRNRTSSKPEKRIELSSEQRKKIIRDAIEKQHNRDLITRRRGERVQEVDIRYRKVASRSRVWSRNNGNSPNKNLKRHYKDHRQDFPELKTQEEYRDKAWSLLENPPRGTRFRITPSGQQKVYIPSDNILIVSSDEGVVQSMYKPIDGIKQFYKD
jgi:hypothetical protein